MKQILYVCTAPPPALNGTDAMFQDIQKLIDRFGGSLLSLYPLKKPSRFVPHCLMGIHNRTALRSAMDQASMIHVFSAVLKPLPCLNRFKGPIIYTVVASAGNRTNPDWFNRHQVNVVVGHEKDEVQLRHRGFDRVEKILPGMALGHLTYTEPPPSPFTLMVGSAPWTRSQFSSKGIDVLLAAMKEIPDLKLTFLWRGLWYDDLIRRVKTLGLESRVEIHNTWMDVNQVLAGCHATVVLAEHERIVKVWPHSAIESLAAGKPVLLSRTIPMSGFVEQQQAGVAVESMHLPDVVRSIEMLKSNFAHMHGPRLQSLAKQQFDIAAMLERYSAMYADGQ